MARFLRLPPTHSVTELFSVPDLVRLGTRVSPHVERVRHRLMPNVTTHDVGVEVVDGIIFAA
jgi:hypothetical protein